MIEELVKALILVFFGVVIGFCVSAAYFPAIHQNPPGTVELYGGGHTYVLYGYEK